MNPRTILRRLTAIVGAALAGLRVHRLIREARLGCSHVHDRDAAAAAVVAMVQGARAFELGVIGFQFSSETHARVANAAAAQGRSTVGARGGDPCPGWS